MEEHRKVKAVRITPELIQEILTIGNRINVEIEQGLPEGAVYNRAYYDGFRGHVVLVFYHPDFEPVQEGALPENLEVVFRRLNDGD